MKIRVNQKTAWLVILGTLAAFGARLHTPLSAGPAQLGASDAVTVRVIVVDSEEKAQRIVARLNGGEDFIALARAESIDPTADTGGFLGKVTLSTLPPS